MFVVPAILSITLDMTQVIVYFRQGELFGKERGLPWAHLLDVSASNFDLVRRGGCWGRWGGRRRRRKRGWECLWLCGRDR